MTPAKFSKIQERFFELLLSFAGWDKITITNGELAGRVDMLVCDMADVLGFPADCQWYTKELLYPKYKDGSF